MFNFRFLLFFIASIAVLSVGIVFLGQENKISPVIAEQPLQEYKTSSVTNEQPLVDVLANKTNHFITEQRPEQQLKAASLPPSFWSMETYIAYNEAELKRQNQLHQRLLKKSHHQEDQLKQLIAENNALRDQLRMREKMIQDQKLDLQSVQSQNTQLQVALSESQKKQVAQKALLTKNKEMKVKIDSQPDLIKRPTHASDASSDESNNNEETYNPLSGSVQFGYNYEQDNNVNRSLDGRLIVDYEELEKYKIHNDLYFEFEDEDGKTKTSKQRWQLQGDYHLAPEDFVYSRSDMQRSRFASYKREDVYAIGYGRKILHSDKHTLNGEIGPGYKIAQPNEGKDEITINEAIIRAYYFYSFVFSDALQFSAEGTVQYGRKSSTYNSLLKAQNRIYQELYLVFDLDYTYTTTVPEDTNNREVTSGLKLLYAF